MTNQAAADLIARSNRLGADPKNTNYAGGNTSAKGTETDPVTGEPVELMWVKGSGGDLGTLTEQGLAVLRLDRLRALVDVYPGVDREDEMVAAFDYSLHGKGGAAPSIDTAMHGLVDAAHVDHLHPDSGIAIATAADGEGLTAKIFGDKVVWVPWRRPGFQLGLDIADDQGAEPAGDRVHPRRPRHHGVGRHIRGERAELALDHRHRGGLHRRARHGRAVRRARAGLRAARAEPSAAQRPPRSPPTIRGLASYDRPQVGHFTDADVVLEFLSREKLAPLAALGTSCPDHFLRTKVRPLVLDLPADASIEDSIARLKELHEQYRADYQAYYDAYATPESPAIRGADPLIVLVPGVGMFSFGANKQTARVAGEFYVNAINVMRGAESLSTYAPISDEREVPHRVLGARGGQAPAHAEAQDARDPHRARHRRGIGHRQGDRDPPRGRGRVRRHRRPRPREGAGRRGRARQHGRRDRRAGERTDASAVQAAIDDAVLAFGGLDLVVNNAGLSLSKPLLETTEADWDLQHDVMAKGSFLVSKAAARVLIDQGLGGDIVYISSKNSVFAGPNNIAYSATKADQAHQVRLLAVELGEYGIKVNGINPDGVVRGSGIFASGWGANRAKTYGIEEEDLGKFYAQRTILKREVLPEHVANAVFVLTGPELSHTTGLHIPVDAGVAAAFLR